MKLLDQAKEIEKLKKIINGAKEDDNGEIYIQPGDILILRHGFSDKRTRFDFERKINYVQPVVYLKGFYWYICPDCSGLHLSHNLGKIQTGCCIDIDCERHLYFRGSHYLIQRKPIVLEDM